MDSKPYLSSSKINGHGPKQSNMVSTEYPQEILQYIPFLYVIWSDDLLSASEISVVQRTIQEDPSLDGDQRAQLIGWLSPEDPPGDGELQRWKQILSSPSPGRSEEHTSELQSRENLVFPLLLADKH